jgi:hypothetical protein
LVNPYGTGGGSNGTIYNVIGNAPIVVTSNTVGDTTTFTVTLSSGFQTTVSTLVTDIAALEVDMTTAQNDITQLQSDVANLQTAELSQVVEDAYQVVVQGTGVYQTVLTYTNPIGADNGTEWFGIADFQSISLPSTIKYKVIANGTTFWEVAIPALYSYGDRVHIEFRAQKLTDTLVAGWVKIEYGTFTSGIGVNNTKAVFINGNAIVADMSANTFTLALQASESTALNTTLISGTIKKFTTV